MISPLAHVDPSAKIGKDVTIHPFAYVDADVVIGDGCEIMPYAAIVGGTRIGTNTKIYQGCVIGADPQDFRWKGDKTYCFIGSDTVIREHVIINRGIHSQGGTRVGDGCIVMAQSHIGHDSVLKGRCVLGNGVALAGNTEIGECSILSSGVIVHENCRVAEWVLVKGGCRVGSNVPPYVIVAHNPVEFFGVNAYIMQKHGFTTEQIDNAAKCYRHLYQTQTSVFNALKRIESDVEPSHLRDTITHFIRTVNNNLVAIPRDLNG